MCWYKRPWKEDGVWQGSLPSVRLAETLHMVLKCTTTDNTPFSHHKGNFQNGKTFRNGNISGIYRPCWVLVSSRLANFLGLSPKLRTPPNIHPVKVFVYLCVLVLVTDANIWLISYFEMWTKELHSPSAGAESSDMFWQYLLTNSVLAKSARLNTLSKHLK